MGVYCFKKKMKGNISFRRGQRPTQQTKRCPAQF